ncbi:hypothetical protein A2116_00485 [Candidatus Jorgensenbacteria bacterium GWA1_49_17]|uniref:methylated-DNA--[protein]-cysteine S-methyltransferase n=1 Tax=Candidatus Jorgensenbacteria bacterium GWA1_49_17 TaxID=1798467 RepID=A0A1F6BTG9_9BACT|nr:MAG: Methylated-DNA/protein-cysteine methyltransferase [Microgenomates group bacterium GW2011_GWC1_46_20]OGG40133.1 MAG: hypothetical protein A2116_00485 [Candidatus Jorgensenbacteria bacterium GWA1_49_17]
MKQFREKVYRITKRIPRGRVSTYAAVARAIGSPRAFRAVGSALNKNPYAPQVPCHRVVRSDGRIGGFASGSKRKTTLLKKEGVEVKKRKINLKKFGFRF